MAQRRRIASISRPPAAAAIADAAVRASVSVRPAPIAIHRLFPGEPIVGPAIPARHAGSVDVFLEALMAAPSGGILVIDDGGRTDQACIGDLTALEVQRAGLAGIVVWGAHRDTAELVRIGLPVWSLGSTPVGPRAAGPRAADALERAAIGDVVVTAGDIVVADDDGVVFIEASAISSLIGSAEGIADVERRQADGMRAGRTLREQLAFADYLDRRRDDPSYDFRRHLARIGGAIEA